MASWRLTEVRNRGFGSYFLFKYWEYFDGNEFDPNKLVQFRFILRMETVRGCDHKNKILNVRIASELQKYCLSINGATEEEMVVFVQKLLKELIKPVHCGKYGRK
jgi:hypothetical protein